MWPRARTFAMLTSFIKPLIQDVNIAKNQPQLAITNVDVYLQEFFLHAFSLLYKHKETFQESKDGFTYVKVAFEEPVSSVLLTWFGE